MSPSLWMLIIVLAVAAFSIRVLGLAAGNTIKSSRYAWVLDELPGLIVISLVASSLAGHSIGTWIAAGAAFCVAYFTNHVIWTMCGGVAVYTLLYALGM